MGEGWYPGKHIREALSGQELPPWALPPSIRVDLREQYKDEAKAYDTYKGLTNRLRALGFDEDAAALDAIASDEFKHHGELGLILQKHGISMITW